MADYFVDSQVSHQDGDVVWHKMTDADVGISPTPLLFDDQPRVLALDDGLRFFDYDDATRTMELKP